MLWLCVHNKYKPHPAASVWWLCVLCLNVLIVHIQYVHGVCPKRPISPYEKVVQYVTTVPRLICYPVLLVRTRDVSSDRRNIPWSPENILIDTVACLQQDLADIRAESRQLRTPGVPPVVPTPRQAAFMTTKVPRFGGTTSWEQYWQVFDAIVLSNGWDDATAALQLLSHLEGDALNVALLAPVSRLTSRMGLVDGLSAHYGSPGRLADYRRQFEKTTRSAGEDPSIFAIALETLAVKSFGGMGQTARLQLIRDRFIAWHSSYELRRYLDSVPLDTPIRDVVDRCRVWESHADPEIRRVSKPGPEPIYPATWLVTRTRSWKRYMWWRSPSRSLRRIKWKICSDDC